MHRYHFGYFSFDPQRLELTGSKGHVALRPKTARLLKVMLEADGAVISKRELLLAVWRSDQVADQSLFQAMSELRRQLGALDAIKTHPNIGYQWVAPVNKGARRKWRIAAGLTGLASTMALAYSFSVVAPATAEQAPSQLPALKALAGGMSSLKANQLEDAERQFALALTENPQFREARLLLAETWLAQGEAQRARAAAHALLAENATQSGSYVNLAAMDLLSRSSQYAGQLDTAVDWAATAAHSARSQGFACAAAELEDRLAELTGLNRSHDTQSRPRQSPLPVAQQRERPAFCDQIHQEDPDTGQRLERSTDPARVCGRPKTTFRSMA